MKKFGRCIPNLPKTKSFFLKKYLFRENQQDFLKFLKIESLVKILFAPAINFDFNLLFRTEPLKNLLSHEGLLVFRQITDLLRLLFFKEFFLSNMKRKHFKDVLYLGNFSLPDSYKLNLTRKNFNEIFLKKPKKPYFSSNFFLVFSFNTVFCRGYFFLCSFLDILNVYFFSLKIWRVKSYTKIFVKTFRKLNSYGSKDSLENFIIHKTFFVMKKRNKQMIFFKQKIQFICNLKVRLYKEFQLILKLIADKIFWIPDFKSFLKKKKNDTSDEFFFLVEGFLFRQKKLDLIKSIKHQLWKERNILEATRNIRVKKKLKIFFSGVYLPLKNPLIMNKIPKKKKEKFIGGTRIGGGFIREKVLLQKKNIFSNFSRIFQPNLNYNGCLFQIILTKVSIKKKKAHPMFEFQILLKNWNRDFFFTFLNIGLFFVLTENVYLKNFSFGIKLPYFLIRKFYPENYPTLRKFKEMRKMRKPVGDKLSKSENFPQVMYFKAINGRSLVQSWDLGKTIPIFYLFFDNFFSNEFKLKLKIVYLFSVKKSIIIQIFLPMLLLWKISKKAKLFVEYGWDKNKKINNKKPTMGNYLNHFHRKPRMLFFGSFNRSDSKNYLVRPSVGEFFREAPLLRCLHNFL